MKKIINFKNTNVNDVNGYLLINNNSGLLIDTAIKYDEIINYLLENNISLTDIFITHFHRDHTSGIFELAKQFSSFIHINKNDFEILVNKAINPHLTQAQLDEISKNKNNIKYDIFTSDIAININGFEIKSIIVGGHTPGSTFYEVDEKWLFVGDTLFKNKIGFHNKMFKNINSPIKEMLELTCSDEKFFKSINLILNNFDEHLIYPGHWEIGFKTSDVKNNNDHEYKKIIYNKDDFIQ